MCDLLTFIGFCFPCEYIQCVLVNELDIMVGCIFAAPGDGEEDVVRIDGFGVRSGDGAFCVGGCAWTSCCAGDH
jgi:hypothetical protein